MIRLLSAVFAVLAGLGMPAMADTRAVYTITDIPVDETADTVIEAQRKAFAAARVVGARQLIQKITLPEDRAKAGGVPIDSALADTLVAAVDIEQEIRGGSRYKGELAVVLNPRMVRAYLQSLNVPYVDRQGPLALLVPISDPDIEAAWANAWPDAKNGALAPLVIARLGGYGGDTGWGDIQSELNAAGAKRGIVARLSGSDGAWRVNLTQLTSAGSTPIGTTRAVATLPDAAAATSAFLDAAWKSQSIVRSGVRTVTDANIRYTSLTEWSTLRAALSRSPLVSDFKVVAVARDGALVSFAFAGDMPGLATDLRQRGVELDPDPQGWVMRSAMTGFSAP